MESPISSQDERDIEVNVVSGASSPEIMSSPILDRKDGRKSPYYDIKKMEKSDSPDCTEKAAGSAPYTSFSISSILNRAEPRKESNVLEAALAAHHFGSVTDAAMLSRTFLNGRKTLQDEKYTGKPAATFTPDNVARVRKMIKDDYVIKDTLGIALAAVYKILGLVKAIKLNILKSVTVAWYTACHKFFRLLGFMMHRDSSSSRTAALTASSLKESNIAVSQHPAYSPDLAMCVFG
ncbi:hypothetical protein EVAR_79856_1 [Eumeta japonica]|uniref:Histone-lysine N-methyltransferase SETMAR n=1 Tax=Eumeta variegata TaxID=151549 RepID=A0A4C1U078_EUMVA|nr:hypothetical protein EVAR_79856_1 [Eumeta japonica]